MPDFDLEESSADDRTYRFRSLIVGSISDRQTLVTGVGANSTARVLDQPCRSSDGLAIWGNWSPVA